MSPTVHEQLETVSVELERKLEELTRANRELRTLLADSGRAGTSADAELRTSALLRALADSIPDPVFVKDDEGRLLLVNPAALETIGKPWEQVLGRTSRECFGAETGAVIAESDRRVMETGQPEAIEQLIRTPDGARWFLTTKAPVRDAEGRITGVVGVARDITERKRAEELRASEAALREADRQKDQFLAMLSHELRNPLAPIRNSLHILERSEPGGEQARRALAVIERQIGHMTWLIDDLLDVTRITHGHVRLHRERLELGELAQQTVEDHRSLFARSGVRLEVVRADEELWVDGDRVRLSQALGNLLQNSVKFTPRGGQATVSLRAELAGGRAILAVRDSGVGIEAEMLPRLFRAFTQSDATLERSKGGLGLGLALVKGLVELHDGWVSAASEGRGAGATFTVALPLAVAPGRSVAAEGGAHATPPRPRRVLVIEDNADAADTLREVLELGDHVVEVAYGGREGVEKARAFHPDVVLCDIGLPEMDGYEVARRIRAELDPVALVAVSGYAQPEDLAMAREAGFDAHLAKPPSIEQLERTLAAVDPARARTS